VKLKALILENFRAFRDCTRVEFNDLTAFIGKNDVGKSSILEALEIFFNNETVKIEPLDVTAKSDSNVIRIGCIFSDLPDALVLDATATTNFEDEHLLNDEGCLEIHKLFKCGSGKPKEEVFLRACHPVVPESGPLLLCKNADLKKMVKAHGIDEGSVDLRVNCALRRAIWAAIPDLSSEVQDVPLNKEDGRLVWDALKKELPVFALFQSDRPCTDDDAQVQDPMKLAVAQALKAVKDDLEAVVKKVQAQVREVAQRTVEKLREMDEELAKELRPEFRKPPSWNSLFSLTLKDEDDIPVNKRGSGVRRLVLLNFFRAEADRRREEIGSSGTIYAIEEPETSQHPEYQQLVVETLRDLAGQDDRQVVITTHVPSLAGLLPTSSLRYVEKLAGGVRSIEPGTDDVLRKIAASLGVLPDPGDKVKLLVCVEGPHDVEFLTHMSKPVREHDASLPEIGVDPRIACVPLGGGTLKQWVESDYLRGLGIPQYHIYDRDIDSPPKYQRHCDDVNARPDSSQAILTTKREMENYLHPDAVQEIFGAAVSFADMDDVVDVVAVAIGTPGRRGKAKVKSRLNGEVTQKVSYSRLSQVDCDGDVVGWYRAMSSYL